MFLNRKQLGFGLLVLALCCILCSSLPQDYPKIISYTNDVLPDSYSFSFMTEDGVSRTEKGEFVNGIWTVIGTTTWTDKDGVGRRYSFTADDKGVVLAPGTALGGESFDVQYLNPQTVGSLIG